MPPGGKAFPIYRLQPFGLYVALPVTSTLSPSAEPCLGVETPGETRELNQRAPETNGAEAARRHNPQTTPNEQGDLWPIWRRLDVEKTSESQGFGHAVLL